VRHVARKPLPLRTAGALNRAARALAGALARGEQPTISGAYKSAGVQRVLRDQMFERCCCFCEAHTEATNYGQVEHYRPKGRAEFAHLAFSWENLLWACGRCNGPKSTHWNHSAPLLDPTVDEPNDHVRWHDAVVVHLTARGEYTITSLDLNGRKNLQRFELRREHLKAARLILIAAQSSLDTDERTNARELLRRWLGPGGAFRGMLSANGIALIE